MTNATDWAVVSWTHTWDDGDRVLAEPGALIYDRARGLTYAATVAPNSKGGAKLTHLSITARPGEVINHGTLKSIPTLDIATAVAEHLAKEAQAGAPLWSMSQRPAGQRPSAEELFEAYDRSTNLAMAKAYEVSASTIDRWVREARKERPDLFGTAKRGRPTSTKTTGSQPGK